MADLTPYKSHKSGWHRSLCFVQKDARLSLPPSVFFTSSASHGPVIHHSFGVGLSGTAELASLRVA